MRITVIAGGVGSARFLAGLVRVVDPAGLTVVVNVGDDERIRGLHVSPDIDTILYHLADLADWERGWGVRDESYTSNNRYRDLAGASGVDGVDLQDWFTLGDRDLATNLLRTRLLEAGATISGATDALRRAMGIGCRVIPVTDDPVRTVFRTSGGETLDFQTYFVRRRQEPAVVGIAFDGIGGARPAPGVLDAIAAADVVVVPPSNPLISVEPVLAVPGVREALSQADGARLGVSPIVGGKALKGPADLLMAALGHDVSAAGVAAIYRGLLDVFVLDERDADLADRVAELGIRPVVADTIMRSPEDAARVAKAVLDGAA